MLDKKKPRFLRSDWYKASRLGKNRKNKQLWRKPKGRHAKKREKKKSRGKQPSIGYSMTRSERGRIHGLMPALIFNPQGLIQVKKDQIAIVSSKVGIKKKIEIAKKAIELKIKIKNLNPQEFLDKISKMREEKKVKNKKEDKVAKGKEVAETKESPKQLTKHPHQESHEHLTKEKSGEEKNE